MKQILSVVMISFILGAAIADNCTPGLKYCGSSLLKKGNYQPQLDQNAYDRTGHIEATGAANALYNCGGGRNGYIQYCSNRCRDNGSGKSDQCA